MNLPSKLPAVAVSCYQVENASETVFLGLKVQIELEIVHAYKKDGIKLLDQSVF